MTATSGGAAGASDLDELELLRRHVEAGWWLRLPPTTQWGHGEVALAPQSAPPEWMLYLAELAGSGSRVCIWLEDVGTARVALRERAEMALARPVATQAPEGVRREVALRPAARVAVTPEGAAASESSQNARETAQAPWARLLDSADRALVEAFEPGESPYYLDAPARKPVCGVVVDGRLLSVAHSSRRTAEACALGIDTLPEARRRGYALAAVRLWMRLVAAEGLVPLYSASAENTASLGLAARAGYVAFARAAYVLRGP